ncbi:hypothetical protein EXN66_Car014480 [Channa argus]|uniref:Uncharacterized protein n=1 Tax=Channa argus TaxID=215402 RepID=A0A6G1Q8Y7_CHAAH|nr:hypothetical protein EXN66_Car014480 [Channa argus]
MVVVVVVMIVYRIVIRVLCPLWNMLVLPVLPIAFTVLLLILFLVIWLAVLTVMLMLMVVVMMMVGAVMMVVVMASVADPLFVFLHHIFHLLLSVFRWGSVGQPLATIHASGCLDVAMVLHSAVVVVMVDVLGSFRFTPQVPFFFLSMSLISILLLHLG